MTISTYRRLMLAGCASVALHSVASAQEAAATSASGATSAAATGAATPQGDGGEITVTGSRLITNGNNSPTPVTVVSVQQLQTTTPSNVPDALNKLPIFGGSHSQTSLNNASNNNVGNYLNLRDVGVIRTLILFDGRRVAPTAFDGSVDTNMIPQMLLQRVDVVTGGASAVYGSDAVTGVVNFVVDHKFKGVSLLAQGGISSRNDDGSQRVGIAAGTDLFGGRAHIEGSAEYYNSEGIGSKMDRPLGKYVYSETGSGTAANPFRLTANTRLSLYSFGGQIRSGPLAGQTFSADGVLSPFNHGIATGTSGIESGGDGAYRINNALAASLRSYQGYGRFSYDLTDDITFYTNVTATKAHNANAFNPFSVNGVTLSSTNAFLPASVRAALAGTSTFTYNKLVSNAAPFITKAEVNNFYVDGGLTGKIGGAFDWNVDYGHSRTSQTVQNVGNVNSARFSAALDAVRDPAGNIVCNVTLTNPGLYPGCVPFNPFGPTAASADAIRYVRETTFFHLVTKTDDVSASISGSPFSTWAGPVRLALSGEYRHVTLLNTSNAQPTDHPSCVGLRYNCSATTLVNTSNIVANASGSQTVKEGAVEVVVPLLRDVPFAQELNLSGAARYTDYRTSGSVWTWKVGGDWHPNDAITFRGTVSQDIRAPTLNELFAPANYSLFAFSDIHTGTSATVNVVTQGNPNLVPEKAKTITFGAVLKPGFLPGFSVSVDYYNIKISHAIAQVGGNSATYQAQCEASGGTSPLCSLYIRPLPFSDRSAANFPTLVLTQGLNVATLKTHGIDGEVNYRTSLGAGSLGLRGLVSYQPKLVQRQLPGSTPIQFAGVAGQGNADGTAKWKLTIDANYAIGGFGIDVLTRWRSSLKQSGDPTLVYADADVPSASYTDLTLTYDIRAPRAKFQFFVSIQNLFDKQPPVFASTAYAGNPGFFYPTVTGDDVIGRYFTAGVRVHF